uniref:Transcription factor bHLH149 n=2 Tax=Nicotiana tabacum TaxID=4097 RepID=A0A1S3Y7F0_TOBAC|nr:PREDICTED: transcription factor bHLH149-like [Nicotiana tabacum]
MKEREMGKGKAINKGRVGCPLLLFLYKTHPFPLPISFNSPPPFLSLSTFYSFLPPPTAVAAAALTTQFESINRSTIRENHSEFCIRKLFLLMASSSTFSNPDANSNPSRESKRKKRRKIGDNGKSEPTASLDQSRWRTQNEQQIYSSKLLQALRQVRRSDDSPSPVIAGRAVRDTADRVLAVTAKGRSRWSRAILTGRLSLRLSQINKKHKKAKVNSINIKSKKPLAAKKRVPALQRKVRVLGRLVPGCQKLPFPNLLEETTDYIAALEMQIRAMTVLTGLLTAGGAGSVASHPDRLG